MAVNENFEIGVDFKLNQESLAAIAKQVEKAASAGATRGVAKAIRGAGGTPQAVPGGAATARSMGAAAKVTSKDFTKAVAAAARENRVIVAKFDDAASTLVKALDRVAKALEKQGGQTAALQRATSQLVSKQVGPSNRNLARDIVANRREAGRQDIGPTERRTDLRTGTARDRPTFQRAAEKKVAARTAAPTRPHPMERYAEQRAKAVAASLDKLSKALSVGGLQKIPNLLQKIGLPTAKDVRVGPGASTEIKTLTGQAKTVTGYIKIVGKEVKEATNIVSKEIRQLLGSPDFQKRVSTAERVSRTDPARAISMLRREIKDLFKLPVVKQGGMAAYQKAGEAEVRIDLRGNKALQDRLGLMKTEAEQIAYLNKLLFNFDDALGRLAKSGVQALGSVGLAEEQAAKSKIKLGEGGRAVEAVLQMQTRNLAGMNIGGRGGMRWARSFQPMQARPIVGGGMPSIMGRGEAEAYKTGMFKREMVREMKTAYVDPRRVPEVSEDLILIDKKAAEKMKSWEPRISEPMKELATDLKEGQRLVHGQIIGYDIEGREIKFDMKGIDAKVDAVEKVVQDGIEGVRMRFSELLPLTTGSKITTMGGFKGVTRVEENMAQRFGAPPGTEVMMSGYGAAKRGILGDVIKMMSSEIARLAKPGMAGGPPGEDRVRAAMEAAEAGDEAKLKAITGGTTGQQVADMIEKAMREGGKDLVEAVQAAAEAFGVKGFTGGQAGAKISAMVGKIPWMRLKEPRAVGPGQMGYQYHDLPAMRALGMRAGTAKMAQDMQDRMNRFTEQEHEFIATINALAGASEVAKENLKEMLPENFKRIPDATAALDDFAGTILDPKFKEAMAIRMPTRGGGESLMRLPAMGKHLAMRGGYQTGLGTQGTNRITRMFDNILQTAQNIRMAEGRIAPDVTAGGRVAEEGYHLTKKRIGEHIAAITKLGMKTEEGKAAAEKFVGALLPVIEALNTPLTEAMQYYRIAGGKRATARPQTAAAAGTPAAEYIKSRPGVMSQMYAIQDVLAGRTPGIKGSGKNLSENVTTSGELFRNMELLQKVMEKLGVTITQDADSVEKLYVNLDDLQQQLIKTLSVEQGLSRARDKTKDPRRIPYAARLGAGLSFSQKELTAVQLRTDVGDELATVKSRLLELASAGKNVDEALAAVERMAGMQTDVAKIPRDAVFLNKQDYDNLVQATMRERGIGRGEAESRMRRTGLLHRFPTTGGGSFLASRARIDPTGLIGPGKIGVPGPMATSSAADLEKMLAPMREMEQSLYKTIEANKGQGAAADAARQELSQLVPALTKLNQLYLATALNLDFDGDKIAWFADTATKAGSGVETFTQKIEKGGVSFQSMMMNVLGQVKGGATGNLAQYGALFGKTAKLREKGYRRPVLQPETGEVAEAEATAHIAGKMSVGLLTDNFNKIQLAVTEGTGVVGDAFATGMDYIMLNINKSLAQKGGAGGTAGPLEFFADLKAGRLQKMFKGMQAGGPGIYGEMGEYNKQMREQMTSAFKGTFLRKGAAGLRGIAKAEGIESLMPKEITYENYLGVVKKMVDSLDLPALITRMFEMMKKNMIRALGQEGLSGPEIAKAMKGMFTPGERGVPGLDIDRMLKQLAPGYMTTRRAEVARTKEATPIEAAQRVMRMFPKKMATELEQMVEEFELEDQVDPKAAAARIAAEARAFFTNMAQSFKIAGRQEDFGKLLSRTYAPETLAKLGGAFVPGKGEEEGQVYISSQRRIKPLIKAIKTLEAAAAGAPTTANQLEEAACAIRKFGSTVAHEKIHEVNKKITEPLERLVRSMQSSSTALGQATPKVIEALMSLGKVNIKRYAAEQRAAGRQAAAAGMDPKDSPQFRDATKRLFRGVGEELLAYQTDPEFLGKLKGKGVSEEAITELRASFDMLREAAPEIINEAMETSQRLAHGILKGLKEGLANVGPETGGIQGDFARIQEVLQGNFPGSEKIRGASEQLRKQESAVLQGVSTLGLGKVAGRGGKLRFEEPLTKTGFEEEFQVSTSRIADILTTMRKGLPDLDVLAAAEREVMSSARDLERGIRGIEGQEGVRRGAGRDVYIKTLREFHSAVSVGFINKARELEEAIAEMKTTGKAAQKPGEFADLIKQLYQTIQAHQEYLNRTLTTRGAGRGTVVSHLATAAGEMVPMAREAGISPSAQMLEEQIQGIAGYGAEGAKFMKQMGGAIEYASEEIERGGDLTQAWAAVWNALIQKPELMHTNLAKVAEIFGKVSRHVGFTDGRLSDAAQSMDELAKEAKKVGRAISGKDIRTLEDLAAIMAGAPKQARVAAARGGAAQGIVQSVEMQYEEAIKVAEDYKKRLQKVITSPGYKKMGELKHFEPITKDIVDPETGKVLQRITIEAKRMGKQIVTSMKQSGAATAGLGSQMRSALRRVVQWGFASGIVYGLVRAFRQAAQVITEVQTKIVSLQKVMDTSITDFEKMQDSASGMAQGFGIAIEDVLDGMVVYGQQGLKMNEIMERTRATLLAVNVTTLSSTEATEALTAAHKVFANAVSSSTGYVDAWAAVAAKHAITAKDLADAVKRSGAAAKTAGMSFNDFLGIVTAIGAVTRQTGKEIATSTKFMMRAMRRPTATKQLLGLGIRAQDVTGELRPAMDILRDVANAWGEMTRAQQLSLAQAMAGIRHYNQFIVLMENFKEAQQASIDASNSQGFAFQKNQLVMKSVAKQMQVLRETVKNLTLSIGKAMLPIITPVISGIGMLVEKFNLLPNILKQIAVLGGGATVVLTRLADFAVDTMDVMFGYGIKEKVKEQGLFGLGMAGIKGIPGMFKGMKMATVGYGKGKFAGQAGMEEADAMVASMGILAKSVLKVRVATTAAAAGFMKMGKAAKLATTGTIVGLAVVLGTLAYASMSAAKSGKELEDAMFDQIGKAKDLAQAHSRHAREIQKVQDLYKKFETAMATVQDPAKFAEALEAGKFKGPTKALKEYQDAMADVGLAMARIDPAAIEGISETGDYLIAVGEGFDRVAVSAEDAQKATVAALQTKVIKAYADELTKATNIWGRLREMMFMDAGLDKELKDARDRIKEIAEKQKEARKEGYFSLGLQLQMNDAINKELEARAKMVEIAGNLKRVMEEMPTFSDLGLAAKTLGPDLKKAMKAAAGTGVFGRGATQGSIAMKYLAKSAGLGGVLGYGSAAMPGLTAETMLERGVGARGGVAGRAGALSIVSTKAAEEILKLSNNITDLTESMKPEEMQAAVTEARTMFSYVDSVTGEVMYKFWNSVAEDYSSYSAEALQEIISRVGAEIVTFDRASIEEAAAKTRRLLTISITGAMAGIREPGAVNLGPRTMRELTPEQRMLASLPDEMQRLVEVQNELEQISRQYNEQITEGDLKEAAAGMATAATNLKVLQKATVDLVQSIQREGFELTVLGHYNQALHELNKTMEDAAAATRDMKIEEQARLKIVKHTSGALAGMAVMPQFEFGKGLQGLSPAERLQRRMGGGVAGTRATMVMLQKTMEASADLQANLEKQMAQFRETVASQQTARERLRAAQEETMKQAGVDEGSIVVRDTILTEAKKQQLTLDRQLSIQEKMAESLGFLAEYQAAGGDAKKQAELMKQALGRATGQQLAEALGAGGDKALRAMTRRITGMRPMGAEEGGLGDWWAKRKYTVGRQAFGLEDFGGDKELFGKYNELVKQIVAIESGIENAVNAGTTYGQAQAAGLAKEQKRLYEQLYAMPAIEKVLRAMGGNLGIDKKVYDAQMEIAENKKEELAITDKQNKAVEEYIQRNGEALALNEAQARSAQQALERIAKPARLAEAAEGFAKTIEDIITDFKKAEALEFSEAQWKEKWKSALEGPFAKVGKPGFKTEFETRRAELEKAAMRPTSLQDYRQRQKDLASLEFDEKEARIKQQQDREVAALRVQQQQAEKLRSAMADALFGGQLEGSPELQQMARNYMDTLTDQLAESEQATMRGGKLRFKGVPGIEDAARVMQQIRGKAEEYERTAQVRAMQEGVKMGTEPIVSRLDESNHLLGQIAESATGAAGVAALPPGAAMGMAPDAARAAKIAATTARRNARFPGLFEPAVGRSNALQQADVAAGRLGNANAVAGVVPRDPQRLTSQERSVERTARGEAARRGRGQEDSDIISKALDLVSAQLAEIIDGISGMGDVGSKVDEATRAVENLGDGIKAEVTGEVTVSNADSITANLSRAVEPLGAQVASAAEQLLLLSNVIDPNDIPVARQFEEFAADLAEKLREKTQEILQAKEEAVGEVSDLKQKIEDQKVQLDVGVSTLQSDLSVLEQAQLTQTEELKQVNKAARRADENAKKALVRR